MGRFSKKARQHPRKINYDFVSVIIGVLGLVIAAVPCVDQLVM
ncbi:hypothetical protein [Streptomyces sp. URMC 129]